MTLVMVPSSFDELENGVLQVPHGQSAQPQIVMSAASVPARYSTLFEDFKLAVSASYNFFTADETIERPLDPSASLESLPRYVTARWVSAPYREVTRRQDKRARDVERSRPAVIPIASIKTSVANGYISAGVVNAIITSPRTIAARAFDEDAFLADPTKAGQQAAKHRTILPIVTTALATNSTRVSFVDPSIVGALDDRRVAATDDIIQLSTLAAVSNVLGSLEVLSEFNQDVPQKNPPPELPSGDDAPTLLYAGYVVERRTVNDDGSLSDPVEFDIDGQNVSSFIDRTVAYGKTYAYRIRTFLQWSHRPNVGFNGADVTDRAHEADRSLVVSFVAGDLSEWERVTIADLVRPDPPDELTIVPRSHRSSIRACWKMPRDHQRDIKRLILLRAVVENGAVGRFVEIGTFLPGNGSYDDIDILTFDGHGRSYIYAMYSVTVHEETSTLSEQIEVKILRKFNGFELPRRRISAPGVELNATGFGSRLPLPDGPKEVLMGSRATFFCREASGSSSLARRDYLLEFKSLATGELRAVNLTLLSTDELSPTRS